MHTCLLVDDDEAIRFLLREILESPQMRVIEAKNGCEALGVLNSQPVDIMITDLVMPEKNGIDLIMEVRSNHPTLPVIAISGGGGITGKFDYLPVAGLIGAARKIYKPFYPDQIRIAVAEMLAGTSMGK